MAFYEGYDLDLPAVGKDCLGFREGLGAGGVIAAFHVYVRLEALYHVGGGWLIEDGHVIHASQGSYYLSALSLGHDGATWTFIPAYRCVRVDAYNQYVTEGARLLQIADVADVEQVEGAIGKDDAQV